MVTILRFHSYFILVKTDVLCFFPSRTFGAAALCQSHAGAADGLSSAERPGAGTGRRHGVLRGTWEVTNQ